MLSLGYTIIAQEMSSLAEAVGLDSYIGFLHELKAGRPSLGLDMIEPLRNPVIDRFVLNLINLGMIGYDDFEESAGTGGAVLLNIEGRKKFFGAYEKWMQSLTTDMTESLWAPRPQIERECLTFKKALLAGTIADWEPYTFK
jgi:CRISPR-associated protein Cas1